MDKFDLRKFLAENRAIQNEQDSRYNRLVKNINDQLFQAVLTAQELADIASNHPDQVDSNLAGQVEKKLRMVYNAIRTGDEHDNTYEDEVFKS